MALGDLLAVIGMERMPLAAPRLMSPRDAAAHTLAKYLERAVWTIPAADTSKTRSFRFNYVKPEWQNEDDEINYPCGGITVITEERQAHNFTPTMVESTWETFGANTVLWKTDERQILFQVDFWVTNRPERRAIDAGIDEYFSAREVGGIQVEGPPEYWSQPVRFVLDSYRGSEFLDSSTMVFGRDRRMIARITATIDDLQLRQARELDPQISLKAGDGPTDLIFPRPPNHT